MPLYEFVCSRCSKEFEEIVGKDAATPACPACARPDDVARVPFGRVMFGKKESFRPPDIKSFTKPRKW